MSELYGIDSSTYHRLPPEDQQAIRDSYRAEQAEAPAPERAGEQASVEAGGLRLSRRIVADRRGPSGGAESPLLTSRA